MLGYSYAKAETFEGKVINIISGDTFELQTDSEVLIIRLWGVDSPEEGQYFNEEAKAWLQKEIYGKEIKVILKGKDRKGLRLGEVFKRRKNINEQIISHGLGWAELRYSKAIYSSLQKTSRENRTGLWQMTSPTSPWVYRRQQSMKTAKSR